MTPSRELLESLPFLAVAEALAFGSDVAAACAVVGRDAAREGAALGEALAELRATYRRVADTVPSLEAAEALSLAWAESTLEHLHHLSCEDPLTGLASLAHVHTRLSDVYREAESSATNVSATHTLVVVDLGATRSTESGQHPLTPAFHLLRVGEVMRTVFSGGETIGRLGPQRIVALVGRKPTLASSVAVLWELLTELDFGVRSPRIWIERVPCVSASAAALLHELSN